MADANKYGGKDSWDDYDNANTMGVGSAARKALVESAAKAAGSVMEGVARAYRDPTGGEPPESVPGGPRGQRRRKPYGQP